MKILLSGAVLIAGLALVSPAAALPGQCSMTGYDDFACEVSVDGSGLTFALPDGQVFSFAVTDGEEGLGYLVGAEAAPGALPDELGRFSPIPEEAGCWLGERDAVRFCVMVPQ